MTKGGAAREVLPTSEPAGISSSQRIGRARLSAPLSTAKVPVERRRLKGARRLPASGPPASVPPPPQQRTECVRPPAAPLSSPTLLVLLSEFGTLPPPLSLLSLLGILVVSEHILSSS